ncbi:HET-domain-containing protein [Fusarium austroafricanum]|uniref:HET-domain-containing protein n=1 Tax=Fusarium austroafricanum TaxID=2364996 RepID=A0A8H4NR28_9HYPO|nr:HET-domain-containing protein [Fusarium austroafricanum]
MAPCTLCRDLQKREDAVRVAFDFLPSEISRQTGCSICTVVHEAITKMEDGEWQFSEHVSRVYATANGEKDETLTLEVYFKDDRPKHTLELYFSAADGDASSSGNVQVRLCEPSESAKTLPANQQRYAALSHCWGDHQSCITQASNISARKDSISWSLIPKTFQDAIRFCLELEIHFLWIDALCIIQDDHADWETESAKMADIYQNAFITLAATRASSDRGGCFNETIQRVPQYTLESSLRGTTQKIMVREKLTHWEMPPTQRSKDLHPLLTRGWVFQERILSPRVVHFSSREMIWECRQEVACECGSMETRAIERFDRVFGGSGAEDDKAYLALDNKSKGPSEFEFNTLQEFLDSSVALHRPFSVPWHSKPWTPIGTGPLQVTDLLITPDNATSSARGLKQKLWMPVQERRRSEGENYPENVVSESGWFRYPWPRSKEENGFFYHIDDQRESSKQWQTVLGHYSSLKLTKESDRLPALSGLASRAASQLGKYYCGLWSNTFISDLLWRVNTLHEGVNRPSRYRGPTWSWVSTTGAVRYWEQLGVNIRRRGHSYDSLIERMNPYFESWNIQLSGRNPFGEVVSGSVVTLA